MSLYEGSINSGWVGSCSSSQWEQNKKKLKTTDL